MEIADISKIPLYNQDENEKGFPDSVTKLVDQINAADCVVFSTPEYNYSIPGVLKNAIDWVSRSPDKPFNNKPAAIIGASPGKIGTARAQYHLRQVGVFLNIRFLNKPEVMIGECMSKYEDGKLTDQGTIDYLGKMIEALREIVD
jgi:chromate reductase